jgi:hypothetical protein
MIYLVTPASNAATANQWVIDNLDPAGNGTFVPNRQDAQGVHQCLISLPNNGSDFVEGMKEHFGFTDKLPAGLTALPDNSP